MKNSILSIETMEYFIVYKVSSNQSFDRNQYNVQTKKKLNMDSKEPPKVWF